MALTAINAQAAHSPMHGNGRMFVWGTFKFTGTDKTGKLPLALTQLESLVITPCTGAGTDEVGRAPDLSKGYLVVPGDGVDVAREATTPTADQAYSYFGVGF